MKIPRLFLLFILCLILSFISVNARSQYQPGKIIIKIKKDSELANKWFAGNRTCELKEFRNILGSHTTSPMVSDQLMKSIYHSVSSGVLFLSTENKFEPLERLCILKVSDSLDIELLARKISKYPGVEYAEPMPARYISTTFPNDPYLSQQYYLYNLKCFDAWDYLNPKDSIIIGIVDTGIDYNHPDLAANIYNNPGETGTDAQGNDKRTNGIDDDGNGFVDDWRGWDFVGNGNPIKGDNDPYPGNKHGTHVAGLCGAVINNGIGIAGTAKYVKLMPVKVAVDDPNNESVVNSYEGILYAASNHAKVINCSWGGTSKSQSEQEIIDAAINLGAVVVGAAGNDGQDVTYYPAGHPGALSVAAVDDLDMKAGFSNYNSTVDVSAPGLDIYSTVPNNSYASMSGTSMATPIASAVAAMVRNIYPDYSPRQVIEHVKATTDNIDSINSPYIGKLGRGRVNALKAVSMKNVLAIILNNYNILDAGQDSIYVIGETIRINAGFLNLLSPAQNVSIKIVADSNYNFQFNSTTFQLGSMATNEIKSLPQPLTFRVPDNILPDYNMEIRFDIYSDTNLINRETVVLTLNPSYRTMDTNNISVTFNNRGNIGYNDYPNNIQGEGFRYKLGSTVLFEGALMVAVSPGRMSDVARDGVQANEENRDFFSNVPFAISNPVNLPAELGFAEFKDRSEFSEAGVSVTQHVYQYADSLRKDFIITEYDIVNNSGTDFNSLYAGLFFDWDISPNGSTDLADFDDIGQFGYVQSLAKRDTVTKDTLPLVGVMLLTPQGYNYYAEDNGGNSDGAPNIYNGFSNEEKWMMMTSDMKRKKSSVTDVSQVISAGPIILKARDTARVAFSIMAGYNIGQLRNAALESYITAKELDIPVRVPGSKNIISQVYPNPIIPGEGNNGMLNIQLNIVQDAEITLYLYDALGRKVDVIFEKKYFTAGAHTPIQLNVARYSNGTYYLLLISGTDTFSIPFVYFY